MWYFADPMKTFLRSWRLFVLVWSVLLAPQVTLVHALSHANTHEAAGKERHASDKVCDSCLALAQLGAALPSHFEWTARVHALPDAPLPAIRQAARRHTEVVRSRGPPAALI